MAKGTWSLSLSSMVIENPSICLYLIQVKDYFRKNLWKIWMGHSKPISSAWKIIPNAGISETSLKIMRSTLNRPLKNVVVKVIKHQIFRGELDPDVVLGLLGLNFLTLEGKAWLCRPQKLARQCCVVERLGIRGPGVRTWLTFQIWSWTTMSFLKPLFLV